MLLKLGLSHQRMVEYLFLSAFSRYPTGKERDEIAADLRVASGPSLGHSRAMATDPPGPQSGNATAYAESWGTADPRRPVLEDLMWAILTSKEFMFNH
jgi:hypothetical protein